ncbi:hypothetical protein CC79DRAFT_922293 [Sarocladium strictum]
MNSSTLQQEWEQNWTFGDLVNTTSNGTIWLDNVDLITRDGHAISRNSLRAPVIAADEWSVDFPNGDTYNASVGTLGLLGAPGSFIEPDTDVDWPQSLLDQLKDSQNISSRFFGLHIGSGQHDQVGSLILGGYAKNGVIGDVGVFDILGNLPFLVDVKLGVETGRSPFERTGSMWQGIGDNEIAKDFMKVGGGKKGSAGMMLNPVVPYIYLPKGNCEAIAENLPVSLDKGLGLWLWNRRSSIRAHRDIACVSRLYPRR